VSAEENKALVRRFYAELDALNASVIEELVAEDFVNHSPRPFPVEPGREGLKQAFELFRRATPGSHEILDQVRVENGKIAEKWSDRDELALLQQLGVVSLPGGAA
jgi:ketosteroid isomerase-like protein